MRMCSDELIREISVRNRSGWLSRLMAWRRVADEEGYLSKWKRVGLCNRVFQTLRS